MSPHTTGSLVRGKSQFLYRINEKQLVLDGAAYADNARLWLGNKAKIVYDQPIGVHAGTGRQTNVLNLYRSNSGFVHGSPGTPLMKTDLSPLIEDARQNMESWSLLAVNDALTRLVSAAPGARSDWEEGDEEWGRVIVDDKVLALVSAKLPLVIAHCVLAASANEWALGRCGAVVIVADNFDDCAFCVDRSLLEKVFNREISTNVNCESLSIGDLWWATV